MARPSCGVHWSRCSTSGRPASPTSWPSQTALPTTSCSRIPWRRASCASTASSPGWRPGHAARDEPDPFSEALATELEHEDVAEDGDFLMF